MDRSRRAATTPARPATDAPVPSASRLTIRARKNRRRPESLWSRVPRPRAIADACGRAVRRSLPAIAATAVITTAGTGAWAGYRFATTSPRFAITSIEVRGAAHLTEAQVLAALPVRLGDNVFATNLEALARTLEASPWISSASAHRELPHTLVVDVVEHAPAAIVDLGGLYLVDASGHPFKQARLDAGDGKDLPVITGIDRAAYERDPAATAALITSVLDVLATWSTTDAMRPAIGELHIDAHRALTLRTYDHATAIQLGVLGPELASRMRTFDAAWAELTDAERSRTRAIHLDARPDQVTVALHPIASPGALHPKD